jgi:hypothetical protein
MGRGCRDVGGHPSRASTRAPASSCIGGRGSIPRRSHGGVAANLQVKAVWRFGGQPRCARIRVHHTPARPTPHAKRPPKNAYSQARTILPGDARWGGWDSNP